MSYQGITLNPEDAQMLESRSFSIEEICRWFRVPPFMVGHVNKQSSWASSVEGMNLLFLTNTLRPMLVNIEQEISRCLLNSKAVNARLLREVHDAVFPDIPFEKSPLKQAA